MSSSDHEYEFESNRPEVILAHAEARKMVLEARSKLHPTSQFLITLFEQVGNMVSGLGCFIILILIVFGVAAFFHVDLLGIIRTLLQTIF